MKLIWRNHRFFLLPVFCLLLAGCGTTNPQSKDSFQLTVDRLIDDGQAHIAVLKINSPCAAGLQVYAGKKNDGVRSEFTQLPSGSNGISAQGLVLLSTTKVDYGDTNWVRIQAVIKVADVIYGNQATRSANYRVRPDTKLENFFSITAENGTYKFLAPLQIALIDGESVNLMLSKSPN
jgi:hypothetical protein